MVDPTRSEVDAARVERRMADLVLDLQPIQDSEDIPSLFAGLARSIVAAIRADACLVSIVEGDGQVLRDIGASVVPPARLHSIAEERRLEDSPVNKRVMATGKAVEISIADSPPEDRYVLEKMAFAHVLITPLSINGKIVGTIEAFRVVDQPFRSDDVSEIEVLTAFAGTAYSKIELTSQLERQYTVTLEALASALEVKDPYTQAHTGRIREMSSALALAMKVPPQELRAIRLGAILHDVGKIGIPDAILLKPGPLDDAEWEVMRTHPEVGVRMLKNIEFLVPALPVIRHHHEAWDGSGYPDGLSGEKIPLGARIVAVCDAYDAMTTDRPYRAGMAPEAACKELLAHANKQFDPICAALLVQVLSSAGDSELERRFVRFAT
ncbi:MAG TPA: HD domain-containing phosphohydrolase [Actinomycetota bacterium]|nr:HD domain-containing phosphohydrolase [Actinomycetota bacterium]